MSARSSVCCNVSSRIVTNNKRRPRDVMLHPHTFPVTLVAMVCVLVLSEATSYTTYGGLPQQQHQHHHLTPWGAASFTNHPHQAHQQQLTYRDDNHVHKQSSSSSTSEDTTAANNNDEEEDTDVMQSAFFRYSDRDTVCAVESALLIRSSGQESSTMLTGTELDHLESIIPCSASQRQKQPERQRFVEAETELEHLESLLSPSRTRFHPKRWNKASDSSVIRTDESFVAPPSESFASSSSSSSSVPPALELASASTAPSLWLSLRGGASRGATTTTTTTKAASAAATTHPANNRPLVFWENMICGAISRSVAQTIMHPANTMKTMLQNSQRSSGGGASGSGVTMMELLQPSQFRRLTAGAGANFVLSVPQGAVNFAVLEFVRKQLGGLVDTTGFLARNKAALGPGLDFVSSAISTVACSVVSTPQMMITDNIMAGNYPNMPAAIKGLSSQHGVRGFYAGWWPGLVGKIPSYALTWTFFQQLKRLRDRVSHRPATDIENSIMGCLASGTTVCIMIPMDTIKTRLVTQAGRAIASDQAYKGIIDCAVRVAREEGVGAFYRGLPPRLVSVVPMIGIQFGVYEFMKRVMQKRQIEVMLLAEEKKLAAKRASLQLKSVSDKKARLSGIGDYESEEVLQEAAMEVAASPEHPYPAPRFHKLLVPVDATSGKAGIFFRR